MKKIIKRLLMLLLVVFIFSCNNKNLENDIIWEKYLKNGARYLKYYETKINYENYTIINKKEKLSKFGIKVNIIKKSNDNYEKEYKFLKGIINDIEIDENNEEVKKFIALLKKDKRKSFFYDKNIKSKIKKTNNNKLIDSYNCVGYNFVNIILEDNGRKSKEIGTIWIDKDSGKCISCEYEGKLALLDTFFLPIKMNIRFNCKYNGINIEKIINEVEIKLNIFKFYNNYNKSKIIYSEFKEL